MDRSELRELRNLIIEARQLQRMIAKGIWNPKTYVADTVKDYRTGFPKTIKIEGIGDETYAERMGRIRENRAIERFKANVQKIESLTVEMESFIEDVDDSEMRTILRMYYLEGMKQHEIGDELGYSRESIGKKIERFWKSEKDKNRTDNNERDTLP